MPSVAFATSCWEKDWKEILLNPDYLRVRQIENHRFPFSEKILVINNVSDFEAVKRAAEERVKEGVLTRIVAADESVLSFFHLERSDFKEGPDAGNYKGVNSDWIFYNALAPLAAIHACRSDYLLYLTGDVRLDEPLDWISPSLKWMEKDPMIFAANPIWNGMKKEAKRESYRRSWNFYRAKQGFSDQIFLVRRSDFQKPIYGEIRPDSQHYPRGDVFEKRVFSYMKNRGLERIIYRHGSYTHQNF